MMDNRFTKFTMIFDDEKDVQLFKDNFFGKIISESKNSINQTEIVAIVPPTLELLLVLRASKFSDVKEIFFKEGFPFDSTTNVISRLLLIDAEKSVVKKLFKIFLGSGNEGTVLPSDLQEASAKYGVSYYDLVKEALSYDGYKFPAFVIAANAAINLYNERLERIAEWIRNNPEDADSFARMNFEYTIANDPKTCSAFSVALFLCGQIDLAEKFQERLDKLEYKLALYIIDKQEKQK